MSLNLGNTGHPPKRLLLAGLLFAALLAALIYRWGVYPKQAAAAVPAATAVLFDSRAGSDGQARSASVALAPFFALFPSLAADYSRFLAADSTLLQGALWMAEQTGATDCALAAVLPAKAKGLAALADSLTPAAHYRGLPIYIPSEGLAFARYRNLWLIGRASRQVESLISQLEDGTRAWAYKPNSAYPLHLRFDNLTGLANSLLGEPLRHLLQQAEQSGTGLSIRSLPSDTLLRMEGLVEGWALAEAPALAAEERDRLAQRVWPYLPANLAWCVWKRLPPLPADDELGQLYFAPWLGPDMASFSLPLPGTWADKRVLLLACQDAAAADAALQALGQAAGQLDAYPYQMFTIRQLLGDALLPALAADGLPNPYYSVLGDYVALSSSKVALEQLINAFVLTHSLAAKPDFLAQWDALALEAPEQWFYADCQVAAGQLAAQGSPLANALSAYSSAIGGTTVGGEFYLEARPASALPDGGPPLQLLWQAPLPAELTAGPFELADGWLVQDQSGQMHCLGQNGQIRWQQPLLGQIIGSIALARSERGAPPAYAFATSGQLHFMNGNGQYLSGFPLQLPTGASSPLLLAELEGPAVLALVVAGTDGHIYAYDKQGNPMPGWAPNALLDTLVRLPMSHAQHDGKDYFLALTEKGSLYTFQRSGELRLPPIALGSHFQSPPYIKVGGQQQRIALGDVQGFAYAINLQGQHFRLQLLPSSKGNAKFRFAQLLGDERHDYIAWDENRLSVHYYEGQVFKQHLDYRLPAPADEAFVLDINGKPCLGWLSRQQQRIYLLDEQGQLMPGFPIAGHTLPTAKPLSSNATLLLCGYGDSLYAYRLNGK